MMVMSFLESVHHPWVAVEGGLMMVMSLLGSIHHPWIVVEGDLVVEISFLESVHHPWLAVEGGPDDGHVILGECTSPMGLL